jgi:glutaredoxin
MENIHIITIKNCSYCLNLVKLLKKFKINFIEEKITKKKKDSYKSKQISTFPQVYFINLKERVLLGGFTETFNLINFIVENKNVNELPVNTTKKNKLRIYKYFLEAILK